MPKINLNGKTVMISTTEKVYTRKLKEQLESLGAQVVFSCCSPHHPSCITVISEEVYKNIQKIDCVIIYNPNIESKDGKTIALELTKQLKEKCSVIVCDTCNKTIGIRRLEDAGAKYLNIIDIPPAQIAHVVADTVAQHRKSSRQAG